MTASRSLVTATLFLLLFSAEPPRPSSPPPPPAVRPYPIQSEERKALMGEYARIHYGIDEWRLKEPRLVVVHFTGTASDQASLSVFKPAALGSSRPDIVSGGAVNVGVHYVIWKDGRIWSLLPETDMGRHAVGYNHVALGIEMTSSSPEGLSQAQRDSCAALVADITRRIPSVEYLCGYHEYMEEGRAHRALYRELMEGYAPPVKTDPGAAFMADLRRILKLKHQIELSD